MGIRNYELHVMKSRNVIKAFKTVVKLLMYGLFNIK